VAEVKNFSKNLGARKVTWGKLLTEDQRISSTTYKI